MNLYIFSNVSRNAAFVLATVFILALFSGCGHIGSAKTTINPARFRASSEEEAVRLATEIGKKEEYKTRTHPIRQTGSMWPLIHENCLVVVAQKPYSFVRDGDICHLLFNTSSGLNLGVVHRVEKRFDGIVSKGDASASFDTNYVTKENYVGIVVAIIEFGDRPPYHPPYVLTSETVAKLK